MNQQRDIGIQKIRARPGRYGYGMGVGIILVDQVYPGYPGDMRNPSAYPFPIQYEVAAGVGGDELIFTEDKSACLEPIRQAAKNLERMGCRAIVGECGYFAYFQQEIRRCVDVPVFMSSLLQVPWAQQVIGPDQDVGVLVAHKDHIKDAHLEAVGIQIGSRYVIGSGPLPELFQMCGVPDVEERTAEYGRLETEIVSVAATFFRSQPKMGALVIECSAMQPFARAIQREIEIPIFSSGTLLDYAYSAAVHRDFYGHV